METRKLIDLLRATIDPNQRQQAEEMLSRVRKTCAFDRAFLCSQHIGFYLFLTTARLTHELLTDTQNYWLRSVVVASCNDE